MTEDTPFPGDEQALRASIEKSQTSVGIDTQNIIHLLQPDLAPLLAKLGSLRSLTFLGANSQGDIYKALFLNGSLVCSIDTGRAGAIVAMQCSAPEGPTPQDWIDHYALDPAGKGASRIILAFFKFLAIAGLGRFAGIRL